MLKFKKINILIAVAIFGLSVVGGGASLKAFSNSRVNLSDEQKEVLEEIRELRKQGDIEGAKKLAEENGLPEVGRKFKGKFNKGKVEDVRNAIESNNYSAFITAIAGNPEKEKITREVFSKIVEAHNLKIKGDDEGARTIMNEIGIKPFGFGPGRSMLENLTDDERVVLDKVKALFDSGDREGARNLMRSLRANR